MWLHFKPRVFAIFSKWKCPLTSFVLKLRVKYHCMESMFNLVFAQFYMSVTFSYQQSWPIWTKLSIEIHMGLLIDILHWNNIPKYFPYWSVFSIPSFGHYQIHCFYCLQFQCYNNLLSFALDFIPHFIISSIKNMFFFHSQFVISQCHKIFYQWRHSVCASILTQTCGWRRLHPASQYLSVYLRWGLYPSSPYQKLLIYSMRRLEAPMQNTCLLQSMCDKSFNYGPGKKTVFFFSWSQQNRWPTIDKFGYKRRWMGRKDCFFLITSDDQHWHFAGHILPKSSKHLWTAGQPCMSLIMRGAAEERRHAQVNELSKLQNTFFAFFSSR